MIFKLLILLSLIACEEGPKTTFEEQLKDDDQTRESFTSEETKIKQTSFGNYDLQYNDHGGFDYIEEDGRFYAASLTNVLDVGMGGYRYHLTYFTGVDDQVSSEVIVNSTDQFYRYSFYEGNRNFIKLIKQGEYVYIFYLAKRALVYRRSDDFSKEIFIVDEVGHFDVARSDAGTIGVIFKNRYSYSLKVHYGELGGSFSQVNSLSLNDKDAQLSLNFYQEKPIISLVAYDEAERTNTFFVYSFEGYWKRAVIARGLPEGEGSNSYVDSEGRVHSCYINAVDERYRFSFDPSRDLVQTEKMDVYSNNIQESCFVSPEEFIQYKSEIYGQKRLDFYAREDIELDYGFDIYKIKRIDDRLLVIGKMNKRFKLLEIK